jgi:hypothetical protein
MGLPTVPVLAEGASFPFRNDQSSVALLKASATGTLPSGKPREGIVTQARDGGWSAASRGRLSFKVISEDYEHFKAGEHASNKADKKKARKPRNGKKALDLVD